MKMVIYECRDEIIVDSYRNYHSYVQKQKRKKRFPKSEWTIEKVINYLCHTTKLKESDFYPPEY